MKYYSFENKGNYIEMKLTGSYKRERFITYPKILFEECQKQKIFVALLDASDVTDAKVTDADKITAVLEMASRFGYILKLAIIWPEKNFSKDTETVARNRGVSILITADKQTALNWLLHDI